MTDPDVLAKRLLHRGHNRDGLAEILIGLLFLAVSGLIYSWTVLDHHTLLFKASVLVFSFGLPAAYLLAGRWVRGIRQRFLIERAGYVEPLPGKSPYRRVWPVGLAAMLVVLTLVAVQPPDYYVTGATGVAGGLLAGIFGREPRFWFAGAVMAASGLAVAFARLEMNSGFAIMFGIQGIVELTSGGIVWKRFMAATREAGAHER